MRAEEWERGTIQSARYLLWCEDHILERGSTIFWSVHHGKCCAGVRVWTSYIHLFVGLYVLGDIHSVILCCILLNTMYVLYLSFLSLVQTTFPLVYAFHETTVSCLAHCVWYAVKSRIDIVQFHISWYSNDYWQHVAYQKRFTSCIWVTSGLQVFICSVWVPQVSYEFIAYA